MVERIVEVPEDAVEGRSNLKPWSEVCAGMCMLARVAAIVVVVVHDKLFSVTKWVG